MAYTYEHPRPSVTLDSVIFKYDEKQVEILLIKRNSEPFKDHWALPGGFLDMDEDLEEGLRRELQEETGIEVGEVLEAGVFGKPGRDPRGRVISIAFVGVVKGNNAKVQAASDAADAQWFDVHKLPDALAFDHSEIIKKTISFVRKGFKSAMVERNAFLGLTNGDMQRFHAYITE